MEIACHILGLENQRCPDLAVSAVERTPSGQNTNDRVGFRIEKNLAADDVLCCAKLVLPQLIADDRRVRFTRVILIGKKSASEGSVHTEDIEVPGGNLGRTQLDWLAYASQRQGVAALGRNMVEDRILACPIEVIQG